MPLPELADYTRWLPAGSALWRAAGGPLAWTVEERQLRDIEYRLRTLVWMKTKDGKNGTNRPKPPKSPEYAREVDAERSHALRQAAAHAERERRRQAN